MPQAILLIMATRAVDFKVFCSQIPRRAFAGIRTHDLGQPKHYTSKLTTRLQESNPQPIALHHQANH
jgi:hypothetical protein